MIFFLSKYNTTLELSPHIMIVKQGLTVARGITLIQFISIFSHPVQCTIERWDEYWNSVLKDKYHFIALYYKIMLHFLLSSVGLTKKKVSEAFYNKTNNVTVAFKGQNFLIHELSALRYFTYSFHRRNTWGVTVLHVMKLFIRARKI